MLQFSKYKVGMWHFVTQMIVLEKICYLQYELNASKHEIKKIYMGLCEANISSTSMIPNNNNLD